MRGGVPSPLAFVGKRRTRDDSMSDADYIRCHYSITCFTDDLAVVHCLRALCQNAEHDCLPQIAWGGTKERDWLANGHCIRLRFTDPAFRDQFVRDAKRLLAPGTWKVVGHNDNDPAVRQRRG
jgi:hypothetical protein